MSTAPLREAVIDLVAVRENIARVAAGAGRPVAVDVGRDAHGHGLVPVASVAVEAGAGVLIVADAAERALLAEAGIRAAVVVDAVVADPLARAAYGVALPGLVPAMSLRAGVVSVKRVAPGQGVSYGLTYRTPASSTLVLVPLGYADGVPRAAGPRAGVLLRGRRHRVAGRIAMDQFVLDVGDAPVELGDTVTVFGPGTDGEPTAADWAEWAGAAPDDIVAGIGRRVARRYRDA